MNFNWRKSSFSGAEGTCVEAASAAGAVAVRDTKQNGMADVLAFAPAGWRMFTRKLEKS